MWKLQQLVEDKEKAEKKAAEGADGGTKEGEDLQIKRSNSKELAENRKEKAKNNVFRIGGAKRGRGRGRNQVQASELRVQADLAELDPDVLLSFVLLFPGDIVMESLF